MRMTSKMQVKVEQGQRIQRPEGPWYVPSTDRKKADAVGLNQADPPGFSAPRQEAATLSSWQGEPWKEWQQGVDRADVLWHCWRTDWQSFKVAAGETHTQVHRFETNPGG